MHATIAVTDTPLLGDGCVPIARVLLLLQHAFSTTAREGRLDGTGVASIHPSSIVQYVQSALAIALGIPVPAATWGG